MGLTFEGDSIIEIELEDNAVIEAISNTFFPEDIFEYDELKEWAENNGFIKKGEQCPNL